MFLLGLIAGHINWRLAIRLAGDSWGKRLDCAERIGIQLVWTLRTVVLHYLSHLCLEFTK
jgi:hypothetical protein